MQTAGQQDPNLPQGIGTTAQIVSTPPRISFEDGQLTILAENSQLSEIMTALRTVMGADIDLPASVARQRIWVRLGPGPARKILRDLLDNTDLDYVIQASDNDPDGIRSVILTLRSRTFEQGAPGSRVARGKGRNSLPESTNSGEVPDQDSSSPAEPAAVANADPAVPPAPSTDGPSRGPRMPSTSAVSDSSLSKPSGIGSSEQMIQQLQSMYQQRKQMQMQQNQKPPSNNN